MESLPHLDEHSVEITAGPEPTWNALLRVVEGSFGSTATGRIARLLGCADLNAAGPRPLATGSSPGLKGGVYRTLVIGTRGHVLVTRRLLDAAKHRAELG